MPDSGSFEWIPPMKGVIGLPATQAGWAAELKWDGIRAQVLTDGADTVLRSSTGRDISSQFPELAGFGRQLGTAAALDGEIVVFDGDRPVFQRVLQRLNVDRPNDTLVADNPAVFVAFDLLRLDGNTTFELPYHARRTVLIDFLSDGPFWRVPPHAEDGADRLMALAEDRGLEGIVCKKLDSTYRPGSRSHDWRKVKIRLRQEFVVGGWLAGQGALEDGIGSLVVGVWDGADLVMAGLAGSGLTDDERRLLAARFTERPDAPFASLPKLDRRPTWVEPTTVVEVGFGDWPADGMLRHPVYLGMRHDREPEDVVRELPPPGAGDGDRP
ncbi:MAG: hypothetical protein AAF547_10675 [Actinomycetota bacterium]